MILALMPLGVEHSLTSHGRCDSLRVILALMPLGVEHMLHSVQRPRKYGDPRIDAVRR